MTYGAGRRRTDYLRPVAVKADALKFEEIGTDEAGKVTGIYKATQGERGEAVTKFECTT